MAQYELNIRDYWRIIKRRKAIIIVMVAAITLGSLIFTALLKPKPEYLATAAVKFDRASTITGLFLEVLTWSPGDTIATQAEVIQSYPVIEGVAKELGLIPKDVGEEAEDEVISKEKMDEYAKKSEEYLRIVSNLQEKITTKQLGNTNLIEISAKDADPKKAQLLANTVAKVYREDNIRSRNRQVIEAKRFIETQLRMLEKKLSESEEALRLFKENEPLLSVPPESRSATGGPMAITVDEYIRIKTNTEMIEKQLGKLSKGETLDPEISIMAEDTSFALYKRLSEEELAKNNLLIHYTKDHPLVKDADAKIEELRNELIKEFSNRLRGYRDRLKILDEQSREFPEKWIQLVRLEREVDMNSNLVSHLKNKYQEALIKGSEQIQEVTIIKPATLPLGPITKSDYGTNILMGVLFGLIFGVLLAFVIEAFDTSIGTIEDVEAFLGLPVLGVVPEIEEKEVKKAIEKEYPTIAEKLSTEFYYRFITHFSPKSVLSESYRSLKTSIQFTSPDKELKTLLVTSASFSERKTSTVINLAIAFGQMGKNVLIVEADMRKPAIHHIFGLKREPGLSEVIIGNATLEEATRTFSDLLLGTFRLEEFLTSPGLDNIHILTSGSIPFNPSELLGSQKMKEFIEKLKGLYDIVIFDAPPVLPLTDSLVLAPGMDGTIIIYQVGRLARSALKRTKSLLDNANARILGIVLTGVKAEISPDYYHHYYYYPSKPAGKTK